MVANTSARLNLQNSLSLQPKKSIRNSALICKRWFEAVKKSSDFWVIAYSWKIICEDKQTLAAAHEEFATFQALLDRTEDCQLVLSIESAFALKRYIPGSGPWIEYIPDFEICTESALLFLDVLQLLLKHKHRISALSLVTFTEDLAPYITAILPEIISSPRLEWISIRVSPARVDEEEGSMFVKNPKFAGYRHAEADQCGEIAFGSLQVVDFVHIPAVSGLQVSSITSLKELRLQSWCSEERPGNWNLVAALLQDSPGLVSAMVELTNIVGLPSSSPSRPKALDSLRFLCLITEAPLFTTLTGAFSFPNVDTLKLEFQWSDLPSVTDSSRQKPTVFPSVRRLAYMSRTEEGSNLLQSYSFPSLDILELFDDSCFDGDDGDKLTFSLPFHVDIAPRKVIFTCFDMTTAVYHLAKVNPTRLESIRLICTEDINTDEHLLETSEVHHWADHSGKTKPSLPALTEIIVSNCHWTKTNQWLEAEYFDLPLLEKISYVDYPPNFTAYLAKEGPFDSDNELRFRKLELPILPNIAECNISDDFKSRCFGEVNEITLVLSATGGSNVTEEIVVLCFTKALKVLSLTALFSEATTVRLKCEELCAFGPGLIAKLAEVAQTLAEERAGWRCPIRDITLHHGGMQTKLL